MNARGILLSGLLLLTHTASAGDKVNYYRCNAGLQAFSVTVNNQGHLPLACQATTAHWYSVELGTLAPGATLSTRLWKNPVTGEVFILNQSQDRLPLQRAWCGIAGDAWRTRADIALPIRRSPTVAAIALRGRRRQGSLSRRRARCQKVERRAARDNVTCRTAARRIDPVKCHIAATRVDPVKCHTAATRVDQPMCRIAAMHATYA